MKPVVTLSIIILLLVATPAAAFDDRYTLRDGDTLERGRGAVQVFGGYPLSGLSYEIAPWDYIQLGVSLKASYVPGFALGVPFKVQVLENEARTLNFALTMTPSFYGSFPQSATDVFVWLDPGFAAGFEFVPSFTWYLRARYMLELPVSEHSPFNHHPIVATGLEIQTASIVNVFAEGLVEFRGYDPDRFVYGGLAGLGFALW